MIRPITPADRSIYLSLMDEFYHSPAVLHPVDRRYWERAVDEMLRSDAYLLGYLFELDGQTAGYAMLARTYSAECGGPVLWIEELYLREAFRSRGLGSEFLHFLEQTFTDTCCRFRLEIEPSNERALALYRRHGFEPLPYLQMIRDFPR
ncbi:MAG: GNAT family N-acetyltransferase [Clostridia bacterium]|nr:GNAT family N-acetyltransferase [Clostridia bacterium]